MFALLVSVNSNHCFPVTCSSHHLEINETKCQVCFFSFHKLPPLLRLLLGEHLWDLWNRCDVL